MFWADETIHSVQRMRANARVAAFYRSAKNMRTSLGSSVFAFLFLCLPAWASLSIEIPAAQDDNNLKYALWTDAKIAPDVEADRKQVYALEEHLRIMKESSLKKAFGPPVALNDSYVLPFSRHTAVGFSGVGYQGNEQRYFLRIGDIGGILVFPYGDQDYVSAVAIYLKADDSFIPLKAENNIADRRKWDHKKLSELSALMNNK